MKKTSKKSVVHGYKVFNPDWTCEDKQYTCPGKFEEKGRLKIDRHGMHFCQTIVDCFNYCSFNPRNKVAEVIAYGKVLKEDDEICTDKLEIVREIPWDEVLRLANIGNHNTGFGNAGNANTGKKNTGDYNIGNYNTGDHNIGNCNTGYGNADCKNTGDYNDGDKNTGDRNIGYKNTGDCNIGNYNTGDHNIGNYNTGDWNIGNCNTGDWNKSSFSTGCFNTVEPKIMLFNKPSDITYRDWLNSDARWLLLQVPKDVVRWICSENMTDEEKAEHPTHETTGGYLKELDESDCAQLWWNNLSEGDKNTILSIPNFDPEIFEECTGIKVS